MSKPTPKLGWAALAAYGAPALPLAALCVPLFIHLPTYYASVQGIGLAAVGAVLFAARMWDVVVDPLVGIASDRTRTSIGRRRPWMLAGVPVCLVAIERLFLPPADAGIVHLLIWSMLLYLGWTMMQLPYGAWGAELTHDYHQRARLAGAREAFTIFGTVGALGLPTLVSGDAAGVDAPASDALRVIAFFLFAGLPLATLLAVGTVREPAPRRTKRASWSESRRALAANAPFRRLILAYMVNGVANGLPATLFLLYVGHVLGFGREAGPLLLTYFACGILGIPLWVWLSRRIGKHRAWCWAMLACCLAFVPAIGLARGDYWSFLGICVATGFCLGADLALPPAMQADVVDADTAISGAERAGLFFALWGMATKLALAVSVGLAFPLLELAGFDAMAEANDPPSLLALAGLYAGVPIILKLIAIALMWRFPLDAAAHADLRMTIERRTVEEPPRHPAHDMPQDR
jgi:Na+/melibiose symporter-like transporter